MGLKRFLNNGPKGSLMMLLKKFLNNGLKGSFIKGLKNMP